MIDVLDHDIREVPRSTGSPKAAPSGRRAGSTKHATVPSHVPSHHPSHHFAVVALLPLRLFLAAGWLRAGAEKLIDPQWWNGNKLRSFLTAQHSEALPFFRPVMESVIRPGAKEVAIVVVVTQLAIGLAIAIGKPMRLALRWGFLLNVVFIMAGKVNPSCFYLVMEIVLLFAIADGVIGVRPSTPSWRSVVIASTSAAAAVAVAPYIRTIEPAKVIEDPAMMLVFLGFIVSVTMLVRRSAYRPPQARYFRRVWTTWYAGWIHAKPKKVVRGEYERRYTAQGASFAPPPRGSVISTLPPLPRSEPTFPTYPSSDVYAREASNYATR
ncbi:MAG: thiosulfate dehydrogenase (quinone) large subunit [Ilumatobacteraceae bacterium]